ncbi:hypothetical protein JB92DRAFT_3236785 [Gautieria morchelliformis]|nr:hypothetical protein JB92DRAFT_3236785 [Gautieria morchelliformis]
MSRLGLANHTSIASLFTRMLDLYDRLQKLNAFLERAVLQIEVKSSESSRAERLSIHKMCVLLSDNYASQISNNFEKDRCGTRGGRCRAGLTTDRDDRAGEGDAGPPPGGHSRH